MKQNYPLLMQHSALSFFLEFENISYIKKEKNLSISY